MMVTIDREECTSCAQCWEQCPEIFVENPDDNRSCIIKKFRTDDEGAEGDIPASLAECALDAADSCPADVITVD